MRDDEAPKSVADVIAWENARETERVAAGGRPYVCVLCGAPWPTIQNTCACGGSCTWGYAKGDRPLTTIRAPHA